VNPQSNPDERFDQVESTLNQLANSLRHLLTAQVLMNERLDRTEAALQKLAEQNVKLAETVQALADSQKQTDSKIEALADSQKHNDSNIEALTEILRQLIERNGNGAANH
jgi:chromosome segregation ATPase